MSAFAIAWFSEGDWMKPHAYAGYLISILLLFRLFWGLLGPRYARFTDFVRSPAAVFSYLRDLARFRAKRHIGHNPAGGAMIVTLLLFLLLTTLTGMLSYGAVGGGPLAELFQMQTSYGSQWLEDMHEFFANATLLLVVVHVGGVIFESVLHKENLLHSMFTGTKRI